MLFTSEFLLSHDSGWERHRASAEALQRLLKLALLLVSLEVSSPDTLEPGGGSVP